MDDAERIVDEAIKRERQKREGLTPSSSRNGSASKPLLVIDPGNLPVVATQLRDALAQSGALYNRGAPVRITESSSDTVPIASPLTAHSVVRLCARLHAPGKGRRGCNAARSRCEHVFGHARRMELAETHRDKRHTAAFT